MRCTKYHHLPGLVVGLIPFFLLNQAGSENAMRFTGKMKIVLPCTEIEATKMETKVVEPK